MRTDEEKNGISVLIVDDEANIRDGSERVLTRMGFQVIQASRGEEALSIIRRDTVSIVLLDLKMPGMDGIEILQQILQIREDMLIIVITGYATVEIAIEAMKKGAYDLIAKPFDTDALRLVVGRAQEKIRLTEEARKLDLEKRRTLADLDTEKSRVRTILESLPTGVVVTNSKGNVVLLNPAIHRLPGLGENCKPGCQVESCVTDRKFGEYLSGISKGKYDDPNEIPSYEITVEDKAVLLARARPIVSEEGEPLGAVVTMSDITTLRTLDRLKSEFVAEVSHELRSPLSTIHQQLATVLKDLRKESLSKDLQIVSRALEKTDGLIALVGDLLDLSRIEAGSAFQEKREVRIEEILQEVVEFLRPRAENKDQRLILDLQEKPSQSVLCDPFAIESSFGNLVSNAINYTGKGGEIRVNLHTEGDEILVSVADNGMGIDERYLDKIFDRFFRVKNDETRQIVGTGLGLPIVKELVEAMGGSVTVSSTPGKGSLFTITLPAKAGREVGNGCPV